MRIHPPEHSGPAAKVALLLAAVIPVAACSSDAPAGAEAGSVVRDSAGIRIVEYSSGATAPRVPLPAEPRYRHGAGEGDYPFSRPALGRLQPDGSAVLTDDRGTEVVVIDADGSSFEMLASNGSGPGEVGRVSSIHVIAQNRILIEDDGNAKFALFVNGELSRTYSTAGDFTIGGAVRAEGIDADGHLLMTTAGFRTGFSGAWLDGHFVHKNLDVAVPDTVGAYPLVPASLPEGPFDPFRPRGFATASGGRFVYTRSDLPDLRWLNPDGSLHQMTLWSPERRTPTDDDFAAFAQQLEADMRRVNPQLNTEQAEQVLADQLGRFQVRYSARLPVLSSVFSDGEGGVWLAEYAPGGDIGEYMVIDAGGLWTATVTAPSSFRLLDVWGDLVLGSLEGELGVQSIVVFELALGLP